MLVYDPCKKDLNIFPVEIEISFGHSVKLVRLQLLLLVYLIVDLGTFVHVSAKNYISINCKHTHL